MRTDFRRQPDGISEICVKTEQDVWIIGGRSGEQQLFVIFDQGLDLVKVCEEVAKLNAAFFHNVFLDALVAQHMTLAPPNPAAPSSSLTPPSSSLAPPPPSSSLAPSLGTTDKPFPSAFPSEPDTPVPTSTQPQPVLLSSTDTDNESVSL